MTSLMDDGNENTIDDHLRDRDDNRKGARAMNDEHVSDMHRSPGSNPNQRKAEPQPAHQPQPGQPAKEHDKEMPGEERDPARPARKDTKRDPKRK